MPKAQKHCKLHDFYAWTVPKNYEKLAKNRPKNANKDLQNASSNFTLFFPTPNPQKRENPSRLKDFRGGSAAGARPRVAKAMLSHHHRTASPDLRAAAPAADPGRIGKEAKQIGIKTLRCFAPWGFRPFSYVYCCEIYLIGLNFHL